MSIGPVTEMIHNHSMTWLRAIHKSFSFYDWFENKVLEVIDHVVPYKLIKPNFKHNSENSQTMFLVRKKRSLLKRWKRNGRLEDKLTNIKADISTHETTNIYCSKCQRFNIQMQGNYNEENTHFIY